jgi:prepilin-type N-terminal cleavage/methylation domain-containing protein
MEKTTNFRKDSGFTLLEVLVALTLLSVGLLGTAMLTTGIIRGNFFSKNVTSATAVAQSTIEGAQRVGYTAVNTYAADSTKVPPTVSMGGVSFSQSASVTNNSPATNMKTISVTVSWNEANNASRSVTLQTILSQ